jgi:ribosomal protein S24E
MNPLFKPVLPLSDAVREKIFKQYTSDPDTWTVRKLATEYNISLRRVDAILKLKAQEKQMESKVRLYAYVVLYCSCFVD